MLEIRDADDEREGLPRRAERGPGYHNPDAPMLTEHVAAVRKHPTQALWAYPIFERTREELLDRLPPQAKARVVAAKPLDPDWVPPGLEE